MYIINAPGKSDRIESKACEYDPNWFIMIQYQTFL